MHALGMYRTTQLPLAICCPIIVILGYIHCREPLEYRMREESPAKSVIANVAQDSHLPDRYPSVYDKFRFRFADTNGPHATYLEVNQRSGVLMTTRVIDREKLCPKLQTCVLDADIAVYPEDYFQIIKVKIQILDKNDNSPKFAKTVQEISVSEVATKGLVYLLPGAEDPDSELNGIQGYRLVPRSHLFNIKVETTDMTNIKLILEGTLDREKEDTYQFHLIAYDGGNPSKSGSLLLDITVSDINDNSPRFRNSSYRVSILENATIFSRVVRVEAKDPDVGVNGEIIYKFTEETQSTYGDKFGIMEDNGQIFLRKQLKFEEQSIYKLSVTARDKGPQSVPTLCQVLIRVIDVNNHPPEAHVQTETISGAIHIPENSGVEKFVAHIKVSDIDSGNNGKFTCSLRDGNFVLHKLYSTEYKILTAKNLDREEKEKYILELICRDSGVPALSSRKYITVVISDENDNKPIFSKQIYTAKLKENNRKGAFIIKVNATDKDKGRNGQVVYSLAKDVDELLRINRFTGVLTAVVSFDREKMRSLQVQVIASDQGSSPKYAKAIVSLTIIDENDQPPKFPQTHYSFSISRNMPVGSSVGRVFAGDADAEENSMFVYFLETKRRAHSTFALDRHKGVITLLKVLSHRNDTFFTFTVRAQDIRKPYLRDDANVSIWITGVHRSKGSQSVLSGHNLTVIFGLSGALAILLFVLIIIVFMCLRPKRSQPPGYHLPIDLGHTRPRHDIDLVRKDFGPREFSVRTGDQKWNDAWEKVFKEELGKVVSQQEQLLPNFKPPPVVISQSEVSVSSRERNHTPDGAPHGECDVISTKHNKGRTERRRASSGSRTSKGGSKCVYNRAYGSRSSTSGTNTELVALASVRDSDSACSADVSHSDSGNCFSDEQDTSQYTGVADPVTEKASCSHGRHHRSRHRCSLPSDKPRRYKHDKRESLSSLDSETPVSGQEQSPSLSQEEGRSQASGPNRIALVHPQRNGERKASDAGAEGNTNHTGSEQGTSLSHGSLPDQHYDSDSDTASSYGPPPQLLSSSTRVKSPDSRDSNTSENSNRTLRMDKAHYGSSCMNDTDFFESDNEARGRNILI